MKNVLLIMLILFSTNCFGQEVIDKEIIDVNYSKHLKISAIYFDKNQSKKTDSSEFISLDNGSMVLKYKDFGSTGNILNVNLEFFKDKIIVSNDGKISTNIKYGTGLSNLQKRLEIQKIGNLSYEIRDDKMQFIIQLNKKD